jgi:hypothetical protein
VDRSIILAGYAIVICFEESQQQRAGVDNFLRRVCKEVIRVLSPCARVIEVEFGKVVEFRICTLIYSRGAASGAALG